MKRSCLFSFQLFLFIIYCFVLQSQTKTEMNETLKVGADAVYRVYRTEVDVLSTEKYSLNKYIEVTVLSDRGKDHSDFYVYYDPDRPVRNISAVLYDSEGKRVKTYSPKDFKDYSEYSGINLFDDNRVKNIEVHYPKYPYTVIFEYTQDVNGYTNFPNWYPQVYFRVGIEIATYRISFPNDLNIRYKLFNSPEPIETKGTSKTTLSWTVRNLAPIESEPYSPRFYEFTPSVLVVPDRFTYKQTSGINSTWDSYGTWVSQLLVDRSDLSISSKDKVLKLIEGIESTREKVKVIYKYMQNHTRYVSIQLGIGGFQPFPASTVETTGYGDCKALSNYTKSLLSLAGIKSHYCEIGVSNTKIVFDDFPSTDQTNHIILCVPLEKDTIWLECTSQNMPFGYLPYNIQNQKVVLIDEEAQLGKLVITSKTSSEYNLQNRRTELEIDEEGNAKGSLYTSVYGGEIENLFPELWQPNNDREKIINRKYGIPGFKLQKFAYGVDEGDSTMAFEDIQLEINKLGSKTGNRLFVKINPFGGNIDVPVKPKERKNDVVINSNRTNHDTVTITIPEGFRIESLPKEQNISTKFGTLTTKYSVFEKQIIFERKYNLVKGKHPSPEIFNLINFLQEINKADKQNVILVKI